MSPDAGSAGGNARITLSPPSGAALIEIPKSAVRDFLRATERLVPRGQEEIDVDAFLRDCLGDD